MKKYYSAFLSFAGIFRPSGGVWYLLQSQAGIFGAYFGIATDSPAPADYDGDGRADIAVFRDGNWFIAQSSNGAVQIRTFGIANDRAAQSSYVY